MRRLEALEAIYDELARCLVVTIMGAVAAELYSLGHRHNFFYMEHSMGLASSMGLGLALCIPQQKVVVLDGDASLLMNLGTLSTMARYHPGNLTHIVFDNESMVSVGGFPTATATGTDLEGIAKAAGVPTTATARDINTFAELATAAIRGDELTCLIAKVEAQRPQSFRLGVHMLENRFQFLRHVQALTVSAQG